MPSHLKNNNPGKKRAAISIAALMSLGFAKSVAKRLSGKLTKNDESRIRGFTRSLAGEGRKKTKK